MGGRVGSVATSEVTVVRRDDGVGSALGDIATVPLSCQELALQADNYMKSSRLTNAGSAGVGQNHTAELLESLKLAITLNSSANLGGIQLVFVPKNRGYDNILPARNRG